MSIDEVPFPAARTLAARVAGLGAPEGALEAGAGDAGAQATASRGSTCPAGTGAVWPAC